MSPLEHQRMCLSYTLSEGECCDGKPQNCIEVRHASELRRQKALARVRAGIIFIQGLVVGSLIGALIGAITFGMALGIAGYL